MLTIEPTGLVLGATAHGIDLAYPLSERDLAQILLALGKHGVLRFPDQHLDLGALKRFSEQFGEIQGGATRERDLTREYPDRHPLEPQGGRQIYRQSGCRPGLAHRHDLSRGAWFCERALRHPHPAPRR